MDERKYTVRRIASLPRSGFRVLLEKSREHLIISAILAVSFILLFIGLYYGSAEGRDKAIRTVTDGLLWGGVYALISVGMVVVYKSTRIFNMAHGGILLFMTYTMWWFMDVASWCPEWLAYIMVILCAIALGLLLDRILFRGMIGQDGLRSFMITMVLGFAVLHGITILVFEGKSQIMPDLFFLPDDTISVRANYNLQWELLMSFIVATVMFLAFVIFFRFTKWGLAMRCVSEDNVISQSLGIRVKRIYAIAWVLGCLSATAGGILLGSLTQVYSESGGLDGFAIFRALPIIVLGGVESIPGAYFGALIIGLLQNVAENYFNEHVPRFSDALPYILLLAVMILRPHGLFGLKGIKRI